MARVTIFKLHRLIQNLNKGEKRSFKLRTKKYNLNSDKSYLSLFDYLEKVEEVDLRKFKQKFKGVKGLSGMQTYLYQQLLKSLRSQDTYKNIDIVLMEGLAELQVLYSKSLLEDTAEKLLEVQKLAEEYQRILLLPLIYEWWFKLQNTRLRYDQVDEATLENYEKKYTEIFPTLSEYTNSRIQLGRIVFITKRKYSREFPELIKRVAESMPPYIPNQQKSVLAEIATLQLRAYLAATMRDTNEAGRYHQHLYNFIKELPEPLHTENKRAYYNTMINIINNSQDVEQFLTVSKDYENIKEADKKYLTSYDYIYVASSQIGAYLSFGLLEECRRCIKALPEKIDYPNKTISTLFQYQFALFHYADKAYDKAMDILDVLLLDKGGAKSINFSSLLKIVILYEQEEYILLSSYLNNVRRNFKKKEVLFEFDKRFISLINKLISLPKKEHKKALIIFRDELKDFLRNAPSIQGEVLLYFNYLGWLDYQIDGTVFKKFHLWNLDQIKTVL
jgi:hypothetical protein